MIQAHLPNSETHILTSASPLCLDSGDALSQLQIAAQSIGDVNAPAVFVMGGISATRHICASRPDNTTGWWQSMSGPGQGLDPERWRLIGMDFLGGNGETSGPRVSDGWPRQITPADQAACVLRLLDELEISQLHTFVGASYGGMVALEFGRRYPERCGHLAILGAAHRPPAMATALRCVQRESVRVCAELGDVAAGLRLSRALGMSTYRSNREFEERFSRQPRPGKPVSFDVEGYLFSRGDQFASEFHPDAYLTLSCSIDCLDTRPEDVGVPTSLLAFEDDFVAPPALMQELHQRLAGPASIRLVPTVFGHDAFLKEVDAVSPWLTEVLTTHTTAGDMLHEN